MRRIVMGVLLAGLALAGSCKAEVSCGKKRESVQSALEPKLEELLGVPVEAIVCPKSSGKQGDTMVCTTTAEGVPFSIDVSFDSDNHFQLATRGIVVGSAAEKAVARRLEEAQLVATKVDCGAKVRAIVVSDSFTCAATVGSEVKTVRVTMNDDSGSVNMTLE